jgi:hypothetical protein
MNLNNTCPTPIADQLLEAFAYAINWRDLHDSTAKRYAETAAHGGQVCDCEDEDFEADDDHECADNLLDADQCMAQAQLAMGLAQAAATAALAAATLLAAKQA